MFYFRLQLLNIKILMNNISFYVTIINMKILMFYFRPQFSHLTVGESISQGSSKNSRATDSSRSLNTYTEKSGEHM